MDARPMRRWYQFSLRTLMIIVTGLCLGPGAYVAYEQNKARSQKTAAEAIQKLGGTLEEFSTRLPRRPVWQRFLLGDDRYAVITAVRINSDAILTDADLANLRMFPRLKVLDLQRTKVSDSQIRDSIAGLTELEILRIDSSRVSSTGIDQLTGLSKLHWLEISHARGLEGGFARLKTKIPKISIEAYDGELPLP